MSSESTLLQTASDDTAAANKEKVSFLQASKPLVQFSVLSGCGVACALAFEKARVLDPSVIQDQMDFSRFVMLKMFLTAVTTGLVSISALSIIPATKQKFITARDAFVAPLKCKGVLSSALGGAILGMGMTISGTCPGMVFIQMGAGVSNAVYTLVGGFAGVLAYGVVEPFIRSAIRPAQPAKHHWVDHHLGMNFASVALPLAAAIGSVVAAVEYYAPWTTEVLTSNTGNFLTAPSWSPIISGIMIGLAQVPLVLTVDDTLGSTTAYHTILAQLIPSSLSKNLLPYFYGVQNNMDNWWQVIYLGSIMATAYTSASLSHTYGNVQGVSVASSLIGGFMLLFGARLASGCTSGHGLSGLGLLKVLSFINVPAIFAGAMGLQFVRNLL